MTDAVAISRVAIEGTLVTIAAFVLFGGSVYLLLAAVFGPRMGYLVAATAFFGFMIILSAIWAFGAPGTPRYLGPTGKLPEWRALAAGRTLTSPTYPVVEEYPGGDWRSPTDEPGLAAEVEPVTLAFQDFLAEEAAKELRGAGIQGEITPDAFMLRDVRFAEVDGRRLAAARAVATGGGPEVVVVGFFHGGDVATPSYAFLGGSILGFLIHLPFLDRAERMRKDVLTGGEQAPWRGPA